ncbi:hypothetical protein BS50DRAFT_476158, partial [Corynespora cassiicola Philippines]
TDPHVDRESLTSAKGSRAAGTCEWITRNASYRAWLHGDGDGDTRLLWISGGPGKGKTMLSVFLTEELERYAAGTANAELVFFFCSQQDEKHNTAVAVLRALVHQIITKRPQLVKHALPFFETPEKTQQTLSSLEALWIIFSKLVQDAELGTMFCVLDGLDECEESGRATLVSKITTLLAPATSSPSAKTTFKLAIVSRDLPGLHGCARVKLDPDNNAEVSSDIERFITVRVDELSRTQGIDGFDDEFRASVQKALLERAEGTFLWVGFAVRELLQKQTCTEIWQALAELPSGLPAIYSRMLLRIPKKHREVSGAMLRWVTMAIRPLQLPELAVAVGIKCSDPRISLDRATRDAIKRCKPFLEIQNEEVQLVHQSARDYLLQNDLDKGGPFDLFRVRSEEAHLELALVCLDCVTNSSLKYKSLDLDEWSYSQESALLAYAVSHWPWHAKNSFLPDADVPCALRQFFETKHLVRHWWAFLLKRINKKDDYGNTGLHLATRQGNETVVRLLVDRGAD